MKKFLLLIFICGVLTYAHDKKTLVERYTNSGCGPCAQLNALWYTATTAQLVNSGTISHIVYNVDWPFANDPMHLLNLADDNMRTAYYGVNAVPWIDINGTDFNTSSGATAFINEVNAGNAEYSPFSIVLTPVKYSNNVINVHIAINRDPSDVTVFGNNVKLQVGITEKTVSYTTPQPNGETEFYSICRKMLPDGKGSLFTIPAPGGTTELDLDYVPTQNFLNLVNFDSLRIVAFIQDDDTKDVYQSEMTDVVPSNSLNASFIADETMGGLPFTVNFQDYSSATDTTSIISWAWDFDNDGIIDSQDPNPSWTYNSEGAYTVTLTVSDGINQYTRTLSNYIHAIGTTSNILVVNGIQYITYPTEMEDFYNSSACFGNHQVDVWDLFGDQGFDYSANSNIQRVDLFNHAIPNSVLQKYQKVIWIGNDFGGDLAFYDPNQVLEYVQIGGNFLLATRYGSHFFNSGLQTYCGIASFTGDSQINSLISMDPNLVDVPAVGTNNLVHFTTLNSTSEAVPIFDDAAATGYIAGFSLHKENEGVFVYIAGRPYRFNNTALESDCNYIIDNFMNSTILPVELVSFTATPSTGEITLNWKTATEINNKGFEIQRKIMDSKNCGEWNSIGFKTGKGTTSEPQNYSFVDNTGEMNSVSLVYRLKQVDFNGTANYSSELFVKSIAPIHFSLGQNYPNPFNPVTTINYSIAKSGQVTLKVYDVLGREVATLVNGFQPANNYRINFDASKLASGIYLYKLKAGEFIQTKKMILIK